MTELSNLSDQISFTHNVSSIVSVIQEVSVIEMQKIRGRVLYVREYMNGLLDIFVDVQIDYEKVLAKEKKPLTDKSRTALVLLSQDDRFSDVNISQVYRQFITDLPSYPNATIFAVGEIANQLLSQAELPASAQLATFNQDSVTELFLSLKEYQQVVVYFGQFKNLLNQEVQKQELSGHQILLAAQKESQRPPHAFLYEPEVKTLIHHFEDEVKRNVLTQAGSESRLAHLGSRIQTLEQSRGTIQEKLHKLDQAFSRAKRQLATKKQLQRLAGRKIWK